MQPQIINVERTSRYVSSYIHIMTAVEDYFLIDCGDEGIYKIREDGTISRVNQLRTLKNDGLEQVSINGVEQLGDTVYLGTTSGLFKRPLSKFFETK